MVATSISVSSVYPLPSACVVKTRASKETIGITSGIAGPWLVVVASEWHLLDRYQYPPRAIRCQVPLYHSAPLRFLLTRISTFGPTITPQ
jgi:hypothetical protein